MGRGVTWHWEALGILTVLGQKPLMLAASVELGPLSEV